MNISISSVCQRVVENLSTAVLVLDDGLRLRWMNPAAEMLLEVSAKQVVGQALAELLPRGRRYVTPLHRILERGDPVTGRGLRVMLPHARAVTLDWTVSVLLAEGQRELLLELNQVDRLLRLTREEARLEQLMANRAVIRGLAHEIKNPLGGLRGAAQLLERALPDAALKEYTRIIIHEADRLRNLVDHLVGPNRPLNRQPTNIHQVFERVRSLILAEVPRGLVIERDYDPSVPELLGDAEQLIQAALNIVRNAAQAMHNEGVIRLRTRIERQFTIGHKRHRLVLRAEVQDNGPGIADDVIDRMFYPMVTGRPEGTGLGLSIAQAIVHQHGGLIQARSRPQCTVFTIYLPLEHGYA
jgi:two-component system nitrogen regulation sensor histidine kinase GlnL